METETLALASAETARDTEIRYAAWLRAKVQEAIDETGSDIPTRW